MFLFLEKEKISDIVQAVTSDMPNMNIASRSIFSFKRFASEWVRRQHIKDILDSFHIQQLGNCFLVIVTVDTIADVMEVVRSIHGFYSNNFISLCTSILFAYIYTVNIPLLTLSYFFFSIVRVFNFHYSVVYSLMCTCIYIYVCTYLL